MDESETGKQQGANRYPTTWGPYLYYGVFVAVLVFFWWMVIYSHGVQPHQ